MIPSRYDVRAAYEALARRYTILARGVAKAARKRIATVRRPAVDPSPQSHDREQAIRAYRARLRKVFMQADERGQIPLAVSLLEQGVGLAAIERALAALPMQTRRGPSLAERMASIPRPDVGSGPSARAADTPKGRAAGLIRAYEKATGSNP